MLLLHGQKESSLLHFQLFSSCRLFLQTSQPWRWCPCCRSSSSQPPSEKPAGYLSVLVAGCSSPFGFNIDLRDSLPKNENSVFLRFTHPHVIPMSFVLHQYVSMTLCCLWNIIENDWRMLVISQLWARLIFISFYGPNNFSKNVLACFIEEGKSYRFGTTCGWVKNEKKKVAIWLLSDFIFTGCNWFLLLRNPYLLAQFWYCM